LTTPPIIKSTGSSLYISYKSDSSDPIQYFGFLGEFYVNKVGSAGSGSLNYPFYSISFSYI
jgi:hypothetical protein